MAVLAATPLIGQPISVERRSRVRFPLELKIRYRTLGRGCPLAGTGWVVNMSRGGVLVLCEHKITSGTRMEMNIEWPFLLDGQVPLQLVTLGRVLRSESSGFAAVLTRRQFRTAGRAVASSIDASCADTGRPAAKIAIA